MAYIILSDDLSGAAGMASLIGPDIGFLTGWFNFSNFAGSLIYTVLIILFIHSPILIWIVLAVIMSIGQLSALALRNIKSGQSLEDISI